MLGSLRRLDPANIHPDLYGFHRCRPAAMQAGLALLLFQEEQGRPADNLDELVPKYLPKLPDDPYQTGQPFHYRVSKGEKIGSASDALEEAPRWINVPPGVGVLWSVGGDGKDDGGVTQARPDGDRAQGEDVIFLVPMPPTRK